MTETTWGSRNAEGMFEIATRFAGFDAKELMAQIIYRTRNSSALKVNERTVTEAMQTIQDRWDAKHKAEGCTINEETGVCDGCRGWC